MTSDSSQRLKLPGFGMPLNEFSDLKDCFMHALSAGRFESVGLKLREVRMMEFMNQITDKAEWERKVFDEDIVARWREEAMMPRAVESDLDGDVYMTEKMFDNCIKELRDKAQEYKETGLICILDAEIEVVKSDSVIPQSLRDGLKAAVMPLEDVPDYKKDWHPGTDCKVLDLLHPSLFPMVYGTSRVLPYGKVPLRDCAKLSGKGETYVPPDGLTEQSSGGPSLLGGMQWLPSDVAWTPSGGTQIVSYVNNLHPEDHAELYAVLSQFVAAAVPLWERCLYTEASRDDVMEPRITQIPAGDEEDFYIPEGVVYDRPPLQEGEDPDDYLYSDEYYDWKTTHRILMWPEPDDYDPDRSRSAELRPDLRSMFPDGLQVIFKLANIHLTPSDPEYDGGSLHVEGALNDRIVATALYYYDCDNITESVLTLHHPVDAEDLRMTPPQGEYHSLERWLGISTDDPSLQRLGRVVTREGRLLAFPNVFAHQVQPFELADKSRPGHRKILAMFLVDPHIRVLSTSVVPPQRKDWWAREIRRIGPLGALPTEIFDQIIEFVHGFPMSWEDALRIRETLMSERSWVKESFYAEMEELLVVHKGPMTMDEALLTQRLETMCVINYNAFICGHRSDTAPAILPCRLQRRLPHEPMCEPANLTYNVKLESMDFCPICKKEIAQAHKDWSAKKSEWRKTKFLPRPVIRQLDRDRAQALGEILVDGIEEGPLHTDHTRLVSASKAMEVEAVRLADRLRASTQRWDNTISALRREGRITESEFAEAERQKLELEEQYAGQVDMLFREKYDITGDLMRLDAERRPPVDILEVLKDAELIDTNEFYRGYGKD